MDHQTTSRFENAAPDPEPVGEYSDAWIIKKRKNRTCTYCRPKERMGRWGATKCPVKIVHESCTKQVSFSLFIADMSRQQGQDSFIEAL
jgi:hypothetical protein